MISCTCVVIISCDELFQRSVTDILWDLFFSLSALIKWLAMGTVSVKLNIKELLVSFVKKMTNLDHSVTRVSCCFKISSLGNDFAALVNWHGVESIIPIVE